MSKPIYDYLLFALLIGLGVCLVFFTLSLRNEGIKCQQNSFSYAAAQAERATGEELFCSCFFSGDKYAPFDFNANNVTYRNLNPVADTRNMHLINLTEMIRLQNESSF